jgi:hypothetical protein
MATTYTVKLPDGNEYGPVDLATLRSWHEEGRITPDTWVWPDGSPEWLTLMDVLAGAGEEAKIPEGPIRLKEEPKEPRVAAARAAQRGPVRAKAPPRRPLGLILGAGAALVAVSGVVAYLLLAPRFERARAGDRMRENALPDRRFADAGIGLKLDLPEGWVLLKPDSGLFVAPQARALFAQASVGAFGTLSIEAVPPGVMTLDVFIDRVVDLRRPVVSDYREVGRVEVTVGGRHARRLQASWVEGGAEQRVTVVVTQDAWTYVGLTAWGPARGGAPVQDAIDLLGRGLQLSGTQDARVKEAADAVQAEVPELSRASLELILRDLLGRGGTVDQVTDASVRAVSQGLPALTRDEVHELQQIYAQVYDPMPEADRQRLAAWLREVRAGQKTQAPEEGQALRQQLKDALIALPEEARQRLQALNEKAIGAAYALR